ncbi:hypothetical protein D1007_34335 [Hordeum vulgare]|nr:hypothetical protein D1007_34335 [Hordeum vulgare]
MPLHLLLPPHACSASPPVADLLGVRLSRLFSPSSLPATIKLPKVPADLWEGSIITGAHIEYLCRTRKLPSEEVLEACTPEGELAPEPRDGERVIFSSHFLVGFELQVSLFLRFFLD